MKPSEFLQKHLDTVSKIEKERPGSVDMLRWVSAFDDLNNCGTVCCMEGWLPVTFPDRFKWHPQRQIVFDLNGDSILSPHSDIEPIIWSYLTGIRAFFDPIYDPLNKIPDIPEINAISSFPTVKEGWEKVIKWYRDQGK